MRRTLVSLVFLCAGCMVSPIPDADRAFDNERFDEAEGLYKEALEGFLTPREYRHVSRRLIEASDREYRARFEQLKRELADEPAPVRAKAYRGLIEEARERARGETVVTNELGQRIDDELMGEWAAVDALLMADEFAEGLELAASWAQYSVAGSKVRQAFDARKSMVAEYYLQRAQAAGPRERAMSNLLAHYYGAELPVEPQLAVREAARAVSTSFVAQGIPCPVLPAASSDPSLTIVVNVTKCAARSAERTREVEYIYARKERGTVTGTRCRTELVTRETESEMMFCRYGIGCGTQVTTYRSTKPERVCREETWEGEIDVPETATRTETVRTTWYDVEGVITAPLPDGTSTTKRLDLHPSEEQVRFDTPHGKQDYEEGSEQRAAELARAEILKIGDSLQEPYRDARARAFLAAASRGEDARESLVTVAFLGTITPELVSDLKARAETVEQAMSGAVYVLPGGDLVAPSEEEITFERYNPNTMLGVDARTARGFGAMDFDVTGHYRSVRDIATQADRSSITFGVGQKFSLLGLLQRNAWGFGFEDEASYFIDFGTRTSEPHVYRNFGGGEDTTENWGSGGAGVAYGVGVGWRAAHFGARTGVRLHASTFKLGDLAAAHTGMPLTVQLEVRGNERYPVMLEAWGLSPFGDKHGVGGRLSLPLGGLAYLVTEVELAEPTINVGGENNDDRVRVGRHRATLGLVSLSWQL